MNRVLRLRFAPALSSTRTTRTTRTAGTAGTAGTARPTLAAASLRTTLITQGYQRIHEILLDHFSVIVSI